jgi:hypothetical protein
VALLLLFILLFFSWTGVYPGGYGIYWQNAWRTIGGGYAADPVGEKALRDTKPFEDIGSNWAMLFYVLLVLIALVLAILPLLQAHTTLQLPGAVKQIQPWRLAILLGATLVAFFILLAQSWVGFGLENAVTAAATKKLETAGANAKTDEDKKIVEIHQGLELDKWNLHRTVKYWLALLCTVVALVGVALEFWLQRRGPRPLPRIDIQW